MKKLPLLLLLVCSICYGQQPIDTSKSEKNIVLECYVYPRKSMDKYYRICIYSDSLLEMRFRKMELKKMIENSNSSYRYSPCDSIDTVLLYKSITLSERDYEYYQNIATKLINNELDTSKGLIVLGGCKVSLTANNRTISYFPYHNTAELTDFYNFLAETCAINLCDFFIKKEIPPAHADVPSE